MTLPKIKKITIVDVDLEPNIWIHGNSNSVVFCRIYNGDEKDTGIELTWEELSEIVFEYKKDCAL